MDSKRAEQIMNSRKNIPVYYKNTPVCIKEVFAKDDRVRVKNLNTDKDMLVSVKTINETYGLSQ